MAFRLHAHRLVLIVFNSHAVNPLTHTKPQWNTLTRADIITLKRLVSDDRITRWLKKFASGTFADVYKVKPLTNREDISGCLAKKLKSKAVRILKQSVKALKPHVFTKENLGTQLVALLPVHENVLRQEVIAPGVSISNLYDCTLKDYAASKKLGADAIQCVLQALAQAIQHLHGNNVGHFDIKPSNILVCVHIGTGAYTHTNKLITL